MDRSSNEFFACTGFSANQNRGIRRGNHLDLLQDVSKRRTVADDFFEITLRPDFIFEVKLFLSEFVFKLFDLTIGQRVFNSNCDLISDLDQQLTFTVREAYLASRSHTERAKLPAMRDQRDAATGFEAALRKFPAPFGIK